MEIFLEHQCRGMADICFIGRGSGIGCVHRDGVCRTEEDVVEEADAVENRADLVIPVGPLPRHTQSEIDLGVCPATDLGGDGNHSAEIYARKSAKAKPALLPALLIVFPFFRNFFRR
jgi:hypothetical protein